MAPRFFWLAELKWAKLRARPPSPGFPEAPAAIAFGSPSTAALRAKPAAPPAGFVLAKNATQLVQSLIRLVKQGIRGPVRSALGSDLRVAGCSRGGELVELVKGARDLGARQLRLLLQLAIAALNFARTSDARLLDGQPCGRA